MDTNTNMKETAPQALELKTEIAADDASLMSAQAYAVLSSGEEKKDEESDGSFVQAPAFTKKQKRDLAKAQALSLREKDAEAAAESAETKAMKTILSSLVFMMKAIGAGYAGNWIIDGNTRALYVRLSATWKTSLEAEKQTVDEIMKMRFDTDEKISMLETRLGDSETKSVTVYPETDYKGQVCLGIEFENFTLDDMKTLFGEKAVVAIEEKRKGKGHKGHKGQDKGHKGQDKGQKGQGKGQGKGHKGQGNGQKGQGNGQKVPKIDTVEDFPEL